MSTIQTLLKKTTQQLSIVSDSPQLDAELLLCHCLDKDRSHLYAWGEKQVDKTTQELFQQLVEKRLTDYPIAYLLGHKEFWSLDLIVTEDVLIPRPETELLVETALDKTQQLTSLKILDLGTGSGAIALAIANERPDAFIIASDYSPKALAIAEQNARYNKLPNVQFIQSNWFTSIKLQHFDLIVSNPPYIQSNDPHLKQSIRHEPLQALTSGETGLDDINIILHSTRNYMKNATWILIEHGYDQGEAVPKLMSKVGLQHSHCIKDYNGNDRLSIGQKG